MKGFLYSAAVLIGLFASCSRNNEKVSEPFTTDCVTYSDSIISESQQVFYSAEVDFPTSGPDILIQNVSKWIAGNINSDMNANNEELANMSDITGTALLKENCDSFFMMAKTGLSEIDKKDYPEQYTYKTEIKKVFQDEAVVTFISTPYIYLGGAHGSSSLIGQTFTMAGKELGWNIFKPGYEKNLLQLIEKNLMKQYFKVETFKELSSLLLTEISEFPLPSSNPFIVDGGIQFVYQQYEIAPYSEGMPTCIIPFDELSELLNQAMIGVE